MTLFKYMVEDSPEVALQDRLQILEGICNSSSAADEIDLTEAVDILL